MQGGVLRPTGVEEKVGGREEGSQEAPRKEKGALKREVA